MRIEDALAALPTQQPFRFVEKVHSWTEDEIEGEMSYAKEHPIIAAHEKVSGLVPGVILLEQASQTALVLAHMNSLVSSEQQLLIGGLQGKFLVPVMAPASVRCDCKIVYNRDNKIGFAAQLFVDGKICAQVKGACHIFGDVDCR